MCKLQNARIINNDNNNIQTMIKRNILRGIAALLLMVAGTQSVWGQTDYSGTYYIANHNGGGYSFASNDNFYMVPAGDPQRSDKSDAY